MLSPHHLLWMGHPRLNLSNLLAKDEKIDWNHKSVSFSFLLLITSMIA